MFLLIISFIPDKESFALVLALLKRQPRVKMKHLLPYLFLSMKMNVDEM